MENPETQHHKESSLQATLREAQQTVSPLLKEAMDDFVSPVQRVLQGKGDAKDVAIVGAEALTAASLVVPGLHWLSKNSEHALQAKSLDEEWKVAEHLPFFDKPQTPPNPDLVLAFDKTHHGVGVVGTTKTTGEGDAAETWFSLGSGFLVDDEGLFVTSHHEIKNKDAVSVSFDRDKSYEVQLLGTDEKKDLALMRVVQSSEDDVFHPIQLSQKPLTPGDEIMAIGIRNGKRVSTGSFAGTSDFAPTHTFNVKAPGGFSGGPLLNTDGEAVGMTLQAANKFQRYPFSEFLTRRFGGDQTYGVSSEDISTFIKENRSKPGKYLQRLHPSLRGDGHE